jgi:nitroreductase
MSDIMTHILSRRSIRKYTNEPVSQEDILRLLQAAMAAPSATNRKPWEFVVVTEPEVLESLRRVLPFGRYNAPAAIIVCGNMGRALPWPARDFWIQDCSAATENILLAATGLGLGAVWVGVHPIGLLVKAVSRVLSLPKGVIPLGVVYVGHPAEAKAPRTQYDDKRVHWQKYISPGDTLNEKLARRCETEQHSD